MAPTGNHLMKAASFLALAAAMAFPMSVSAVPAELPPAPAQFVGTAQDGQVVIPYKGADDTETIVNMARQQSRTMPTFIMLASRTCGYCEDLSAMFTRASRQLSIPVRVMKVDIDDYPAIKTGMRFRRATPDTHAYQNGAEAYSFLGALPYENMVNGLKSMSAAISKGPGRAP